MARYGILPEAQRALLSPLAPLKDLGFALYGGTAIAMQIGHRVSIDFDLFSDRSVARSEVIETLPFLRNSETLQDEANTWTVQTAATSGQAGVKLSLFTNLGFGRVGTPALDERGDLLLASLDDLLGHKLGVLLQRVEAKDYLDIAAMLDRETNAGGRPGCSSDVVPEPPALRSRARARVFRRRRSSEPAAEHESHARHRRRPPRQACTRATAT